MNSLNTGVLLLAAYLASYLVSCQTALSQWLSVQLDLRPALMVYCGLYAGWTTLTIVALTGGVCFDALSANRLGVSILPLFLVAFFVHINRGLILREQRYAQFVLGVLASAAAPALTVLLLFGVGQTPLIGWGSIGQWLAMTVVGGGFTPVLFWLFERFRLAFNYQVASESSFRPDREIKRGRG